MPGLQINNPIPVGRKGEDGAATWLIASRDDIDAGNLNGPAQRYDEMSGEFTDVRPLQVWFKFGVWPAVDHDTPLPFDPDHFPGGDKHGTKNREAGEKKGGSAAAGTRPPSGGTVTRSFFLTPDIPTGIEPAEKAWVEEDHPRHPAGSERGGQFAPADGAGVGDGVGVADVSEAALWGKKDLTVEEFLLWQNRHAAPLDGEEEYGSFNSQLARMRAITNFDSFQAAVGRWAGATGHEHAPMIIKELARTSPDLADSPEFLYALSRHLGFSAGDFITQAWPANTSVDRADFLAAVIHYEAPQIDDLMSVYRWVNENLAPAEESNSYLFDDVLNTYNRTLLADVMLGKVNPANITIDDIDVFAEAYKDRVTSTMPPKPVVDAAVANWHQEHADLSPEERVAEISTMWEERTGDHLIPLAYALAEPVIDFAPAQITEHQIDLNLIKRPVGEHLRRKIKENIEKTGALDWREVMNGLGVHMSTDTMPAKRFLDESAEKAGSLNEALLYRGEIARVEASRLAGDTLRTANDRSGEKARKAATQIVNMAIKEGITDFGELSSKLVSSGYMYTAELMDRASDYGMTGFEPKHALSALAHYVKRFTLRYGEVLTGESIWDDQSAFGSADVLLPPPMLRPLLESATWADAFNALGDHVKGRSTSNYAFTMYRPAAPASREEFQQIIAAVSPLNTPEASMVLGNVQKTMVENLMTLHTLEQAGKNGVTVGDMLSLAGEVGIVGVSMDRLRLAGNWDSMEWSEIAPYARAFHPIDILKTFVPKLGVDNMPGEVALALVTSAADRAKERGAGSILGYLVQWAPDERRELIVQDVLEKARAIEKTTLVDRNTGEIRKKPANTAWHKKFAPQNKDYWKEASEQKNEIAQSSKGSFSGLSSYRGMDGDKAAYQAASDFIEQWAHSSNDGDTRSLRIQEAARREFGVELTPWQQDALDTAEKTPIALFDNDRDAEIDLMRGALRDMYDRTQQHFKDAGVTHVRLYRGVKRLPGASKFMSAGTMIDYKDNALSSWSTDFSVAQRFARGNFDSNTATPVGVVLETVVPVENILSTARTGFGCLSEQELVVLGMPEGEISHARIAVPPMRIPKASFLDILDAQKSLKAWDEEKHPRHPAGSEQGGEFAPSDGGASATAGDLVAAMAGETPKAKPPAKTKAKKGKIPSELVQAIRGIQTAQDGGTSIIDGLESIGVRTLSEVVSVLRNIPGKYPGSSFDKHTGPFVMKLVERFGANGTYGDLLAIGGWTGKDYLIRGFAEESGLFKMLLGDKSFGDVLEDIKSKTGASLNHLGEDTIDTLIENVASLSDEDLELLWLSRPRRPYLALRNRPDAYARWEGAEDRIIAKSVDSATGEIVDTSSRAPETVGGAADWFRDTIENKYPRAGAEGAKRRITAALQEDGSGVGAPLPAQVSFFDRYWRDSSNGRTGSEIQLVVSKMLGITPSEWQRPLLENAEKQVARSGYGGEYATNNMPRMPDIARAYYENTQAELKEAGITHVRLFRGVALTPEQSAGVKRGDVMPFDDNVLSSWTPDIGSAFEFATGISQMFAARKGSEYGAGAIISTVVPIERIFGTAHNGLGYEKAREFVVTGSNEPAHAMVHAVYAERPRRDPRSPFKAWDPEKHPRHPAGSEQGGQFAPAEFTIAAQREKRTMSKLERWEALTKLSEDDFFKADGISLDDVSLWLTAQVAKAQEVNKFASVDHWMLDNFSHVDELNRMVAGYLDEKAEQFKKSRPDDVFTPMAAQDFLYQDFRGDGLTPFHDWAVMKYFGQTPEQALADRWLGHTPRRSDDFASIAVRLEMPDFENAEDAYNHVSGLLDQSRISIGSTGGVRVAIEATRKLKNPTLEDVGFFAGSFSDANFVPLDSGLVEKLTKDWWAKTEGMSAIERLNQAYRDFDGFQKTALPAAALLPIVDELPLDKAIAHLYGAHFRAEHLSDPHTLEFYRRLIDRVALEADEKEGKLIDVTEAARRLGDNAAEASIYGDDYKSAYRKQSREQATTLRSYMLWRGNDAQRMVDLAKDEGLDVDGLVKYTKRWRNNVGISTAENRFKVLELAHEAGMDVKPAHVLEAYAQFDNGYQRPATWDEVARGTLPNDDVLSILKQATWRDFIDVAAQMGNDAHKMAGAPVIAPQSVGELREMLREVERAYESNPRFVPKSVSQFVASRALQRFSGELTVNDLLATKFIKGDGALGVDELKLASDVGSVTWDDLAGRYSAYVRPSAIISGVGGVLDPMSIPDALAYQTVHMVISAASDSEDPNFWYKDMAGWSLDTPDGVTTIEETKRIVDSAVWKAYQYGESGLVDRAGNAASDPGNKKWLRSFGARRNDPNEAGDQKDSIVKSLQHVRVEGIAEGQEYSVTNSLIKQWSHSSNDNDMRSLNLQVAAAEEFGVALTDWQKERIAEREGKDSYRLYSTAHDSATEVAATRRYLRAMYDQTQAQFKKDGVTHLRLWRGVEELQGVDTDAIHTGDMVRFRDNALSSWSTDESVARRFGDFVMEAVIPIENIISTARTGFGCLDEQEVVVIGAPEGVDTYARRSTPTFTLPPGFKPPKQKAVKAWNEAEHPRHEAGSEQGGEFAPKDGYSSGGGERAERDRRLVNRMAGESDPNENGASPAKGKRVWHGKQHAPPEGKKRVKKSDVGKAGELLVMNMLYRDTGLTFRSVNEGLSNAPIDVVGDHLAIEVKAGLATNQGGAQAWRATIGEPGKAEKEALALMSAAEKAAYNKVKREAIMKRKHAFVDRLNAANQTDEPIEPATMCMIFDAELKRADVYVIDGFHEQMRWHQYATDEYYYGTFDLEDFGISL